MKARQKISLIVLFVLSSILAVILFFQHNEHTVLNDRGAYIPAGTSVVDKQFNFHFVSPGIWRSAQPDEESLARMKKHGLKTVINLRRDDNNHLWEKELVARLGMQYYYFPMDADREQDPKKIDEVLAVMANAEKRPVLLHCAGGKDRTGLAVMAYKIANTDEQFSDIFRESLMLGYHADRYPEVLQSVKRWCKVRGDEETVREIEAEDLATLSV